MMIRDITNLFSIILIRFAGFFCGKFSTKIILFLDYFQSIFSTGKPIKISIECIEGTFVFTDAYNIAINKHRIIFDFIVYRLTNLIYTISNVKKKQKKKVFKIKS